MHGVELWESPNKFHCQAKSDDETPCPVEISRRYGCHEVTRAELVEVVDDIPLPLALNTEHGSGTDRVRGHWDWDNNQFVIEPLESWEYCNSDTSQRRPGVNLGYTPN